MLSILKFNLSKSINFPRKLLKLSGDFFVYGGFFIIVFSIDKQKAKLIFYAGGKQGSAYQQKEVKEVKNNIELLLCFPSGFWEKKMRRTARRTLFGLLLVALIEMPLYAGLSQYNNFSTANNFINQYVTENPDNANKPFVFLFYNNFPCETCPQTMAAIYQLIETKYPDKFNLFEIDYSEPGEFNFEIDYQLDQPLTMVMVPVHNGQALGYEKIENPQLFFGDSYYFTSRISEALDNLLLM